MPSMIPDPAIDTGQEDLESIENNISELKARFITPIEKIRSISRPNSSQPGAKNPEDPSETIFNDFKDLKISGAEALESRASAFYRMIGLPIISPDGQAYYNPGFPFNSVRINHQNVNDKILKSEPLKNILSEREILPKQLLKIFGRQDINASVYTLLLRHVNKFAVFKAPLALDALTPDLFKTSIEARDSEIKNIIKENPQLATSVQAAVASLPSTKSVKHIIGPFMTDPRIAVTVMPDVNLVCVPFLSDKNSTALAPNTFLPRPGIELIIRERLAASAENEFLFRELNKILSGEVSANKDIASIDITTLKNSVRALSDANEINDATRDLFSKFTNVQALTITELVKTIKVVIRTLAVAMKVIDTAREEINWIPVPDVSGPESGANGAKLSTTGVNGSRSPIDSKIIELRIKKLNAAYQLNDRTDIGSFISPFSATSRVDNVSLHNEEFSNLTQKRDRIARNAFHAMEEIEIITGEISGLGLIDILAVYTALWAIDIKDLMGLLDPESIKRATAFEPTVADIKQTSILDAKNNLEKLILNVLSFADKLLEEQQLSPRDIFGGSV